MRSPGPGPGARIVKEVQHPKTKHGVAHVDRKRGADKGALVALILDQGDDHAVQVEEEHDEVEAELDEGLLLMDVEFPEDLGRVQEVGVVNNPTKDTRLAYVFLPNKSPTRTARRKTEQKNVDSVVGIIKKTILLDVPREERGVKDQRQPVAVDEEQEGQEAVNGRFGDDVRVESVAKVDRVDVVAVYTLVSCCRTATTPQKHTG